MFLKLNNEGNHFINIYLNFLKLKYLKNNVFLKWKLKLSLFINFDSLE